MPKKKKIDEEQMEFYLPQADLSCPIETSQVYKAIVQGPLSSSPLFCRANGLLYQADSIHWLKELPDSCIDMIFADLWKRPYPPEYGKVCEKEGINPNTGRYEMTNKAA